MRKKRVSAGVGVTEEEWREFRAMLIKRGKSVEKVLAVYVRKYISRERREAEKMRGGEVVAGPAVGPRVPGKPVG